MTSPSFLCPHFTRILKDVLLITLQKMYVLYYRCLIADQTIHLDQSQASNHKILFLMSSSFFMTSPGDLSSSSAILD